MPNAILNKTSGSSGQTVVQVTPESYIGRNDATKEIIFTNAKGTTAKLTCLFKGTGEYIYDNPVITEVIAPNFPAGGGTKQLQFKGYQIYRETSDGEEVGRLEFTQDTVADGFIKHMENVNAVPSDVTLDKKNCKATVGSKGTDVSVDTTKFSINLSITYNGKSTTQQNIPWKQDANAIIKREFISWHAGYSGLVKNINVAADSTSYKIDKLVNVKVTYSSGSTANTTDNASLSVIKSYTGWSLDSNTGIVTYTVNNTTDSIDAIEVNMEYGIGDARQYVVLRFVQAGIEPAISITPSLLTFESGSTMPQNIIVDSTDSWTAE